MNSKKPLVLTQYRDGGKYRNFLGHLYHFPKSYIDNFKQLPVEFVFYEPVKEGAGEYYGAGLVEEIVPDNESDDNFFAVIKDYQEFDHPVSYRDSKGGLIEGKSPHYNAQNAVRKLPSDIYNEICLEGGYKFRFKSDAHLVRVLGEQLIGSEKVGILELIKNAIDAQASYCRVRIEKIEKLGDPIKSNYEFDDYDGPVIIIEDDGIGMTKEVLENGWLRPASTIKTNIKEQLKRERELAKKSGNLGTYDALIKKLKKEHGNRIPLGEKGVGRFATHRLGKYLELKTKTSDLPYELVLKINWDKFDIISDDYIDLDSVEISIEKQEPSRDYGKLGSGTQLIIYGGREGFTWNKKSVIDLNRAILSLNSPGTKRFNKSSDFLSNREKYAIFLASLECPQIDDLPTEQIYEQAIPNFSFDVLVDDKGIAQYTLEFKHPEEKLPNQSWDEIDKDLRVIDRDDKEYWFENGEKRKPECGAFFIHMDVWYRTKEWIHLSNYKEMAEYLSEFGGMSIYRDNILIFDAKLGSEIDWLELNDERIKNVSKLSYRDFIGFVEIEQSKNMELIDKTNREGLIDNQAFKDLAKLTQVAINNILELQYLAKRDELTKLTQGVLTDPKRLTQIAKTNSTLVSNIRSSNYPFDDDPYTFFAGLWEKVGDRKVGLVNLENSIKELQKSIEMLEEVQDQFVEQAGFGIAVSISLHEINKIATNFYHSVIHVVKSGNLDKFELDELKETSKSLQTELKRLGPLRSIKNETLIQFNVERSIRYATELYKLRLEKSNIKVSIINPDGGFMIYGRYSAINQVFANLFDNSIYWIENSDKPDKKIKIKVDNEFRSVVFADSGDDIDSVIRPYLFQPGYSLRIPKSGLGLYICKSYLDSMKARIYETPQKDRISGIEGAHFTLDFGRTPEEKG